MGLNETLDRLARERETRETTDNAPLTEEVRDCATYIFFNRMLKDINHGMGEAKIDEMIIDEMITRSIRIAQMLHKRLYE